MARIEDLKQRTMDRNLVHSAVDCTYTVFTDDNGRKYLQLDTYGSHERKLKGKKSQTIQLGEKAARELLRILAREF